MRLLALTLFALLAPTVWAQETVATAHLENWPLSAHESPVPDRHWRGLDVLPFIDRLSLTLAVSDGGDAPDVAARLTWRMGGEGIKRGRRVPARVLPPGIHMVAFVLRADVMQGGARVAGLTLAVDSTRLPAGEVLLVEPAATWDVLFDEASADAARRIVAAGFTLENLRLVRAAFGVFDARTSNGARRERVVNQSVYDAYPDVWIEVAWDLAWLFRDGGNGGRYGRYAARGATGRGEGKGGDRADEDEDDDESGELLPAALGLGAAVVAGAVISGSGGLSFQGNEPIGLMSGFVRPRGGVVLQASANAQALGMEKGDESLTAQVFAFYGRARQPFQPAVGVGVRYHEQAGETEIKPAITAGTMWRLGRFSLLTGYEFVGQRPAIGLMYSWK